MTTTFRILALDIILCVAPLRAALSVETGQCSANTGSATTTCTTGFQGKAVILWTDGSTANNAGGSNATYSIGFSDATNHRCVAWASDGAVATSNAGKSWRTTRALDIITNGTPTIARGITGVAFNAAPNMVLTWDGTPASAYLVNYILIGGSDITDVIVGTHTLATSGASQSVTGLSFQPTFGMWIGAMMTAAGTSGAGAEANLSIGFAKDSTHEFAMSLGVDDAQTMAANVNAVSITHNNATLSGITLGAQTEDLLADFTSFNSDGYTLNVSNLPTAAYQVGYLLIKGGQWDVGTTAAPTTATAFSATGMAFQPTAGFWLKSSPTADNTITSVAQVSTGAATSTSTEITTFAGENDNINTVITINQRNDKVMQGGNLVSSDLNNADFTSFNSDGWTLTNDATGIAAQIGWFAMSNNAVVNTYDGNKQIISY